MVHAACNNGTSAFVTKPGKLLMFGKEAMHSDAAGYVTFGEKAMHFDVDGLKPALGEQHIVRVALGKAHCIALTDKGDVISFGLNNKNQCGRTLHKSMQPFGGANNSGAATALRDSAFRKIVMPTANLRSTANTSSRSSQRNDHRSLAAAATMSTSNAPEHSLCDFDEHHIDVQSQCKVCPFCRECTGYNTSCVVSQMIEREQRLPGADCACGRGEAGCVKCGACATCIAAQENGSGKKDRMR